MHRVGHTERGRLLLYFDILGFREMIRDGTAGDVYGKLNACLQTFRTVEKNVPDCATIYFSDTLLLYQRTRGFTKRGFFDFVLASRIVFTSLLSNDIPVSGAIAFGPFTVKSDHAAQHQLYFGPPLIEAYDVARGEKWLGTVVCPSVTGLLSDEQIELHERADLWRQRKDKEGTVLLLNPFEPISRHHKVRTLSGRRPDPNALEARSPLQALAFVARKANALHRKRDFTSLISARYQNTLGFARSMLPHGCFEWALSAIDEIVPLKRLLAKIRQDTD
jgi:hypothetical protein